jgi:hypothetical protein
MLLANIKTSKKCAFCKYWYDPTNNAIQPSNPKLNLWKYDGNVKNKCLKTNLKKPAHSTCPKYECKLDIM